MGPRRGLPAVDGHGQGREIARDVEQGRREVVFPAGELVEVAVDLEGAGGHGAALPDQGIRSAGPDPGHDRIPLGIHRPAPGQAQPPGAIRALDIGQAIEVRRGRVQGQPGQDRQGRGGREQLGGVHDEGGAGGLDQGQGIHQHGVPAVPAQAHDIDDRQRIQRIRYVDAVLFAVHIHDGEGGRGEDREGIDGAAGQDGEGEFIPGHEMIHGGQFQPLLPLLILGRGGHILGDHVVGAGFLSHAPGEGGAHAEDAGEVRGTLEGHARHAIGLMAVEVHRALAAPRVHIGRGAVGAHGPGQAGVPGHRIHGVIGRADGQGGRGDRRGRVGGGQTGFAIVDPGIVVFLIGQRDEPGEAPARPERLLQGQGVGTHGIVWIGGVQQGIRRGRQEDISAGGGLRGPGPQDGFHIREGPLAQELARVVDRHTGDAAGLAPFDAGGVHVAEEPHGALAAPGLLDANPGSGVAAAAGQGAAEGSEFGGQGAIRIGEIQGDLPQRGLGEVALQRLLDAREREQVGREVQGVAGAGQGFGEAVERHPIRRGGAETFDGGGAPGAHYTPPVICPGRSTTPRARAATVMASRHWEPNCSMVRRSEPMIWLPRMSMWMGWD